MTTEISLDERNRYQDLMNTLIGVGVSGFVAATAASIVAPDGVDDLFLFAGVAVYYLGFLGYLVVWQRTGVRLFDEREAHIEQRASQIVVLTLIVVTIFALPADVLFDVTGFVDVPVAVRGAIWAYAVLLGYALLVYGYVAERTQ